MLRLTARIGIVIGLLLCGLSLLGMVEAPVKGTTQFIPMMAGIPLLFLGIIGLNPHRRRTAVWISMVTAILATVYATLRYFQVLHRDGPLASIDERIVIAMFVLSVAYLGWSAITIWRHRVATPTVEEPPPSLPVRPKEPERSDGEKPTVARRRSAS